MAEGKKEGRRLAMGQHGRGQAIHQMFGTGVEILENLVAPPATHQFYHVYGCASLEKSSGAAGAKGACGDNPRFITGQNGRVLDVPCEGLACDQLVGTRFVAEGEQRCILRRIPGF